MKFVQKVGTAISIGLMLAVSSLTLTTPAQAHPHTEVPRGLTASASVEGKKKMRLPCRDYAVALLCKGPEKPKGQWIYWME